MKSIKIKYIVQAGIIAAIYCVLTIAFAPISYGPIQARISEALTIMPFFMPAAVPGLFVGCLLANILGGNGILDIVFGSLSTLIAAYITYKINNKYLAPLPAVVVNAITIPFILLYIYDLPYFIGMFQVFVGQLIVCYALGLPLLLILDKQKDKFRGWLR